jgi:hypothetical protein
MAALKQPKTVVRKAATPKLPVREKVAPPDPVPSGICDGCSKPMVADDAQCCEDCGQVFCERCIGRLDHDCES